MDRTTSPSAVRGSLACRTRSLAEEISEVSIVYVFQAMTPERDTAVGENRDESRAHVRPQTLQGRSWQRAALRGGGVGLTDEGGGSQFAWTGRWVGEKRSRDVWGEVRWAP
jgi:hypothetical protein